MSAQALALLHGCCTEPPTISTWRPTLCPRPRQEELGIIDEQLRSDGWCVHPPPSVCLSMLRRRPSPPPTATAHRHRTPAATAAAAFTTRAHSHMSPSRHLDEVEDDELDFALPTSTRRKSWLGSVCCCFSGGDERRLSL